MSGLGNLTPDTDGLSFLVEHFPQEELCDELEDYLEENVGGLGQCIRHPLVYSIMHNPVLNGRVNKQLQYKREALARAEEAKDWYTFIFLHERPYRVRGFQTIMEKMTDAEYWELLSRIWTDSENIRQEPKIWEALLRSNRPERQMIMEEDERAALAAMDAVIPVYQGHTARRHDGWSWTINITTAIWFGQRFAKLENSAPRLTTGSVRKADVIAYFDRRAESEILAPRPRVFDRSTIVLEKKL